MRKKLAATCEALIALLDEIDGDENLEETTDDEPLLGWPNAGQQPTAEMANDDDREEENEHGGNVEDEPQLDEAEYDGPGFILVGQGL